MDKTSIIIVTFNSSKTIKICLDSIINFSPDTEIIVVDNNSEDDTVQIIQNFGNRIILIETGSNLGFAKANNLGANLATHEYLIFMNPDTRIIEKNSLNLLRKSLEENTQYGLIGPKLIFPDGLEQPRVRNLPTLKRAFQEYILGAKGTYNFYQPDCKTLCEVESIIGACIIIRKKLFQKVGGFNEKYFMYFEDLELCKKIRSLGLKVGFLPEIKIEHAEGKSGVNQKTNVLLHDSAKKYYGLLDYYLIELILMFQRIKNKKFF